MMQKLAVPVVSPAKINFTAGKNGVARMIP
jgi:hypothetical protein